MADVIKYVSLDRLKQYDTKIKNYIDTADLSFKANLEGQVTVVANALDAEITRAKAAEVAAQNAADKAQGEVDALETYVGTFTHATAKSVVEYVDAKTSGIATDAALGELQATVTQLGKDIDAVEADYLKAADKTELEGKITAAQNAAEAAQGAVNTLSGTHATDKKALEDAIALKADQTALDGVSAVANAAVKQSDYDVKVKALDDEDARIVGLVEAEAERAAGIEAGLEERLVEVETFFKTTEGETLDEALDTLVELQTYLSGEGAVADQMLLDIAANKKAIEDHVATNHDFAAADTALKNELTAEITKKADKTTVEGIDGRVGTLETEMDTVEGKVSTLEGQMTTVQGAVATKAEAQALADAKAELTTAIENAKTDASNKDAVVLAEAQKVATAVQTALDTHTANGDIHVTAEQKTQWSAAVQASDITVGTANGTIAVKGTDVAVKGLGSAAYVATTAFDAAGSAAQALTDAKDYIDAEIANFVECTEAEINALFNA